MSQLPDEVETSKENKVFFPDEGFTKGDLIDYYHRIADTMLPHVRDRALVMRRFPDGIGGKSFVQQEAPDYFPNWIERATVGKKEGGKVDHVLCQNQATLVYLANQGCITPHIWLSRQGQLNNPDRMIFDLDPSDDDFTSVQDAAAALRGVLEELKLKVFAMTTGSRGLHLVVPLDRHDEFKATRAFARDVAAITAQREPEKLTIEQRREQRRGRLFLDTGRNAYGQTTVAPYAVRARPGAPVATPLAIDELNDTRLNARRYNIRTLFKRLGQKDDPWKDIYQAAQRLPHRLLADMMQGEQHQG